MSNIGIVIPTVRPENYSQFLESWNDLFSAHDVTLITVHDGEEPMVEIKAFGVQDGLSFQMKIDLALFGNVKMGVFDEVKDLIYNKNDGVRNLGFAFIAKYFPHIEYIITLDDDVAPVGDPIQDHINALNMKVPVSWMSTASEYMRGFPYDIREEADVVLSHGVWDGVKDWDAPTQLIHGNRKVTFYKGVIPKGVLFPMCIMNVGFKRKMLPYMYQAPMGEKVGLDRFADIWCGINAKRSLDSKGWAAVSGYSTILHKRASNVFVNLAKEAKGIGLNEEYWRGRHEHEYFKLYHERLKLWQEFMEKYL